MIKRILKGLPFLMSALLCIMPMRVYAAPSEGLLLCAAMNEEGLQVLFPGIPFILNGEKYVFSSNKLYMAGCDYYLVIDDENVVAMEYQGTELSMTLFTVSTGSSSLFYDLYFPVLGEPSTIIFISAEGEIESIDAKITGYSQSGDFYELDIEVERDIDYYDPAVIVNSDGQVVAFLCEGGVVYSLLEPISGGGSGQSEGGGSNRPSDGQPDGSSGGGTDKPSRTYPSREDSGSTGSEKSDDDDNEMFLIIGVVVAILVIAVVVVIFAKNKNKKTVNPNPAPQDVPVSPPQENNGSDLSYNQRTMPVWEPSPVEKPPAAASEGSKGIELYLVGVGGPLSGLEYRISEKTITIGRAVESSICYPADTKGISRRHCQIFWRNGVLMIMDLGSTSGTFLREKGQLQPNSPVVIKEGDVIYLGSKQNALTIQVKEKN